MTRSLWSPLHKDDVSSPGVLQGWWWKSSKISAAFVVVGSLLSSLPWPLRLPYPAGPPPLWGLLSVRRPHSNPAPAGLTPPLLKSLSLISMPLGLPSLLLPNKHSQNLLPCPPHCQFLWSSITIHLFLYLLFYSSCYSFQCFQHMLSFVLTSSLVSSFRVVPCSRDVSSVVCVSPDASLSSCVLYMESSGWGKQ